jgi:hypothetical protein
MDMWQAIQANLLTPMPLFFALGVVASLVRSDLKVPEQMYTGLVLYLLTAIGLKGGAEIHEVGFRSIWATLLAAAFLGAFIPCVGFVILRKIGKFSVHDAAAVAGHYGSVSAVTFAAGSQFLSSLNFHPEPYMSAFLAIMEPIGIVAAIFLARVMLQLEELDSVRQRGWLRPVLSEVLTGKGTIVLLGALMIGYLSGPDGHVMTKAFFVDPFKGVLCLFMLEMGLLAAQRMAEVRAVGSFLVGFALLMPMVYGLMGVVTGAVVGLSIAGATLLGVLAGSASYIAAPAAMRLSLPQANPSFYLTASLGITFPFNIAFGIPLYFWFASLLWR